MRGVKLSPEGKRRIVEAYLPTLAGEADEADLADVVLVVYEWLLAGEYARGVLLGELGLHRHDDGALCVHDIERADGAPALDALEVVWPDIIGTLRGPPRGVLSASKPVDLVAGLVAVQVSAPLLTSAQRYAKTLADAILAVTGVTLEPIFSAQPVEP